jgi:hypothetical protein
MLLARGQHPHASNKNSVRNREERNGEALALPYVRLTLSPSLHLGSVSRNFLVSHQGRNFCSILPR